MPCKRSACCTRLEDPRRKSRATRSSLSHRRPRLCMERRHHLYRPDWRWWSSGQWQLEHGRHRRQAFPHRCFSSRCLVHLLHDALDLRYHPRHPRGGRTHMPNSNMIMGLERPVFTLVAGLYFFFALHHRKYILLRLDWLLSGAILTERSPRRIAPPTDQVNLPYCRVLSRLQRLPGLSRE